MEGLSVAMRSACELGIFQGIQIPNGGPKISHLLHADDALFIGEWSRNNISNLARILHCFHVSSGLKVNFNKSKVFGVGSDMQEVARWASTLGCEPSALPFTYLGVPVGANMNLKKNWEPIIERFRSKLSKWKSKSLSFGGRLTLTQSVLGNLPTYFLSLFLAPDGIIQTLEKLRRRFLWGASVDKKKIHWVSWDRVVAPKEMGGLWIGTIKSLNISLLMKWWWKLRTEPHHLWAQVISSLHNLKVKPDGIYSKKSLTRVWNNIAGIKKALGKKEIPIESVLSKQHTTNGETWRCCLSSTGTYEVRDLRHRWDYTTSVMDGQISWLKEVPLKVYCFIWRAKMGRIPVAVELAKRGVVPENLTCPMCNEYEEDSNHVLVDCSYARSVCEGVSRWCNIQLGPLHTVKDVLGSISQWGVCKKRRRIILAIYYGTLWSLWKTRNEMVFKKNRLPPDKVTDIIKSVVYLWVKNRGNNDKLNWASWSHCPWLF
ncbi:uncharacterized protein LOC111908165 [Lactuca sativa]|uniref:Reverse transcriptase zinc-binding domain-containing protein n=1 Tax=Lactuca sativa TaxID=4236 RepID=A0A9R1V281_LACSA|nr:uncharacterized protein LOC111908165 [Lactuca sativa]KAJ0198211.1 hypothetical protein LSAT_V11C700345480 [Lactuca sativa]